MRFFQQNVHKRLSLDFAPALRMKHIQLATSLYVAVLVVSISGLLRATGTLPPPTEAPTGVDNRTADPVTANQPQHIADEATFAERDTIEKGLGPVFNMRSCADCHQNPITGGISQVSELRAGSIAGGVFTPATVVLNRFGAGGSITVAGRSLINQEAICAAKITDAAGLPTFNFPNTDMHERLGTGSNDTIRSVRTTTNILGDGFVEVVADSTLLGITAAQRSTNPLLVGWPFHPAGVPGVNLSAGENTVVDLLERPGHTRVGRFGWKSQLASLVSFAGGAYLNEMGITNRIVPHEVTGDGVLCDTAADPEDVDDDVTTFARFMRTTKPQSRDAGVAATAAAQAGSVLFDRVGCAFCHTRSIVTAPAGTTFVGVDDSFTPGADLVVSAAMGNKVIHPFSDFALHNVHPDFIGDTQAGGVPISFLKTRTAPLWGLRFRNQMMHDGSAETPAEAIRKHDGEAEFAQQNFLELSDAQKRQLIEFLRSL
jgi:CxxC motif-containing protein (DUF1111 family)